MSAGRRRFWTIMPAHPAAAAHADRRRALLRLTDYLAGRTPQLAPELPLDELIDAELLAQRITDALVAAAVQTGARAMPVLALAAKTLAEDQLMA